MLICKDRAVNQSMSKEKKEKKRENSKKVDTHTVMRTLWDGKRSEQVMEYVNQCACEPPWNKRPK